MSGGNNFAPFLGGQNVNGNWKTHTFNCNFAELLQFRRGN